MSKIAPFLWYDGQAEEAANFYVSLFPDSRIVTVSRYGEGAPVPAGTVMSVKFLLAGQEFLALNGGPQYRFTEAVSFLVDCSTQEEIDHYWSKLSEGGEEGPCGWLKDRFGLSWQITPGRLGQLLTDPDRQKAGRVLVAMMKMKKIVLADLEKAYEGR